MAYEVTAIYNQDCSALAPTRYGDVSIITAT